jgi:hypothetical protein
MKYEILVFGFDLLIMRVEVLIFNPICFLGFIWICFDLGVIEFIYIYIYIYIISFRF